MSNETGRSRAHAGDPAQRIIVGLSGTNRQSRRRPPRSPDRKRSLERRRRLSAAGLMPPGLACKFTLGERACTETGREA